VAKHVTRKTSRASEVKLQMFRNSYVQIRVEVLGPDRVTQFNGCFIFWKLWVLTPCWTRMSRQGFLRWPQPIQTVDDMSPQIRPLLFTPIPIQYSVIIALLSDGKNEESEAILVTGLGGLWGCEVLRILHCLESWLTYDGKVVSPKHRARPTPHKHYFPASGTHFC
jgi:hypothetical protein